MQWNGTSSTWTYTVGGSHQQELYNASGVLTKLIDGESGASYTLTYGTGGQLSEVTSSGGEALVLPALQRCESTPVIGSC